MIWALADPVRLNWPLMLLFGLHQWAITDSYMLAMVRAGQPRPSRWKAVRISLFMAVCLIVVYAIVRRTAAQYGTVVVVRSSMFEPILSRGDRIFVSNEKNFKRGDIVLRARSGSLERIIALPGELVRIENGGIFINESPLPESNYPLSDKIITNERIQTARLRVPENSYCVFFPARISRHYAIKPNNLLNYFMIHKRRLRGKVTMKYYPGVTFFQ